MARTPAQEKALVAKALKSTSKSAGMRELFEAGMEVADVAAAFDVQYGFAYGVARRGGFITPTPRAAKAPAKTKAPARPAAKATAAKAAPRAKATARRTAATKSKAKA